MQIQKREQLEKLDTKRLLSLKRTLNRTMGFMSSDDEAWDSISEQEFKNYKIYFDLIKEILGTREHIVR